MAYVYDNKTYRNLQQQVKENMDDIARLQNLKLVGLDVSHIVDTEEDLADITAEQGMVVAVGTEQPYKLFVYNDSSWVDFGEFPKAGPQGAQGPQGQVGNPGPRGLTGEPGPRGYTGAAGPAGSPGPQGARGPQGPVGPKGDRGLVDAYAADAESITAVGQAYVDENGYLQVCTSLSPLTFEQGGSVKGPKGDTGEQGPQGIQGEQGAQGPTGATGPQGARGPQGEQGIRGPQGEQGIQGPQGPTGATGPEGAQGPKGDTGPQGPTGPTGPQGPKGDPGLTASVEVNGQVYTTDSTGKITLPDYPDEVAWGNIQGTLSDQTDLQTALDAKQDVISDLATIRSGAAAGATAVQPAALQTALEDKVDKEVVGESPQITGYVDNSGDNVGIGVNYGEGGNVDDTYTTINAGTDTVQLEASKYGEDENNESTITTSSIEMTPDYIALSSPQITLNTNASDAPITINRPDGKGGNEEYDLFEVGLNRVTSLGGNAGAITLGSNLSISGGELNVSNLVTTNTAQTITGYKTIYNGMFFDYDHDHTIEINPGYNSSPIKIELEDDYDTADFYKNKLVFNDNDGKTTTYGNGVIKRLPTFGGTELIFTLPSSSGTLALTSQIPSNYVTTNTAQIITGVKTFDGDEDNDAYIPLKVKYDSNETEFIDIYDYEEECHTKLDTKASSDVTISFPAKSGTLAVTSDIPTNYVTTDTQQTISGIKSFTANTKFTADNYINTDYISMTTGTLSNNYLAIIPVTSSGISSYCGTQLNPWTSVNADVINADDINVTNVYANNLINGSTTIAVANIADKSNSETWTFTLSDNTTVTKTVVLG